MIRKYTKVKCISCGTVIERLHLHKDGHKCIKCQERINREKANERNRALSDSKVGFVAKTHDGYFEPIQSVQRESQEAINNNNWESQNNR